MNLLKGREERKVRKQVEIQMELESERRKWCVSQALYFDDLRTDELEKTANKIYNYVCGGK